MEYVKVSDLKNYLARNSLEIVGSIDRTGSVLGMRKRFGWKRYKVILSGSYYYALDNRR